MMSVCGRLMKQHQKRMPNQYHENFRCFVIILFLFTYLFDSRTLHSFKLIEYKI